MKLQHVWIFQANPDHFALDEYLAHHTDITWAIRQKHYASQIQIGDLVYLWRAQGASKEPAGIVAEAIITQLPKEMPEDTEAQVYWRKSEAEDPRLRVRLSVTKYAQNKKQVIKRDWLKEDPVLKGLSILSLAQQTNYLVESKAQQQRLADLWANTGRDWSEQESIAGLWAYHQTYGQSVSKTKGSFIAEIATKIGRPVGGVYNKVMNFRAIDPRDERSGLTGGSMTDEAVWGRFYDPINKRLVADDLEKAFTLYWSEQPQPSALLDTPSLDQLPLNNFDPQTIQDTRQKTLTAIALRRGQRRFRQALLNLYQGRCLVTGCTVPEVLEAAHIFPYQGEETNHPENGLLLRADIHTLFDLGLMSIEPDSLTIRVADSLKQSDYTGLQGKTLNLPKNTRLLPSREALNQHFNEIFVKPAPNEALPV